MYECPALESMRQQNPTLYADILASARECLGQSVRMAAFDKAVSETEFAVVVQVGPIQVGNRFGDCVLRWTDGARRDFLVSGVEADARKLDEDVLFDILTGEGVAGEDAAKIVEACW